MSSRALAPARLLGLGALFLLLSTGCEEEVLPPPPPPVQVVDAARSTVEVTPATGLPADGVARARVQVTLQDKDGKPVAGQPVWVEVTDAQPLVQQSAAPTDAQGVATASVRSLQAGVKTVRVRVGTQLLTAQPTVEFVPLPAEQLVFLAAPTTVAAGSPVSVTVAVQDALGQRVQGDGAEVELVLAAGPEGASLEGSTTARVVGGVAHFPEVVLKTVGGGNVLTAQAAGLRSATSRAFPVLAGAARTLVVEGLPQQAQAGDASALEVVVRDAQGNPATGFRGTVRFTSTDAAAALPAPYTFTAGDAGRHAFEVSLRTAGAHTVEVVEVASAALKATASVEVVAAPATRLAFVAQPEGGTVRAVLAPVSVELTDAWGNRVSQSSPPVTVARKDGGGLVGTLTVDPFEGVATFDALQLEEEATGVVLEATAEGLAPAGSTPFDVVDDASPATPALQVGSVGFDSVELRWLAVGDDGLEGQATSHTLRFLAATVASEEEWAQATVVDIGAPQAPGSQEAVVVTGLTPDTAYLFRLEVRDGGGLVGRAETAQRTALHPCADTTCTPPADACAADGVSLVTHTSACVLVDGAPQCQDVATTTACAGPDGLCHADACIQAPAPQSGELRITEVMHSPSAGTTEYVELLNTTTGYRNAAGLTLRFEQAGIPVTATLGADRLLVAPGQRLVLGAVGDMTVNGGVPVDAAYGESLSLQGDGTLSLLADVTQVDTLVYGAGFPQTPGRAMAVAAPVEGTSSSVHPWYWCEATEVLAGGDLGTPGAANGSCGMAVSAPVDWCAIQYPKSMDTPLAPGAALTVYTQFWEPHVTTRREWGNDAYPHVQAELGYGTDAADPASWTWVAAEPNPGFNGSQNNDELQAVLSIPTAGSYAYGFRYRMREPASGTWGAWSYCDQNGVVEPPAGTWGSVTVAQP